MNALEVSPIDYHTRLKFNKEDMFAEDSYLSKSVLWSSHGISLWHWKNHSEFKKTPSMTWGSLIDCLSTNPSEFDDLFAIKPATYEAPSSTKKDAPIIDKPWNGNASFCRQWADDNKDKDIISAEQLVEAHEHVDILTRSHGLSAAIFQQSKKQVILHCKTKDGLNLKGLADLIPPRDFTYNGKKHAPFLADLKMCADFTEEGFSKAVAKFGYHVQAGKYLLMWNNMNPDDQRKNFKFIWQNPATGEVAVTELSIDDIVVGQAMTKHLIARLMTAYKLDYFPMLTGEESPITSRPMWSQMADEEALYGEASTQNTTI